MKKIGIILLTMLVVGLMGCAPASRDETDEHPEKETLEGDKVEPVKETAKSTYSVEGYIAEVNSNLELQSEALINNLQKLHTYTFYSQVELLDFVSFPESSELSITMFSMDRQANEVFYDGKDPAIFGGSVSIIEGVNYGERFGGQSEEFWEFYEAKSEEIEEEEKRAFANWFAECWEKANGKSVPLPAYFSIQDDTESFDLKKNDWIMDEEKWSY
ncbi:hypothetical protein [Peribacillus sp. FSL E2-0218]|uniref:hypothetical protein n=1 Tax=Peribacillus sp. FSL E2-0218 TaxID=2921364 RepID=UPI0030EE9D59